VIFEKAAGSALRTCLDIKVQAAVLAEGLRLSDIPD
jgi:hypothetical protein